MEKNLFIKVKFEVNANPNLKDWNEATNEARDEYVKERVREFLLENIDELMDGSNIKY